MVQAPKHGAAVMPPTGAHTVTTTLVTDPNMQKEMDALRAQLSMADQRSMEYDRLMNGLKAEKSELEKKLAAAAKGVAAGAGAGATAAEKVELEDLRAKLKEYEVIEDDLANLKKFKKENDDLKQQVEKLGGKVEASVQTTVSGSAQTKDETVTKIENVTEKITEPVTVISGASAKPAEDGVVVAGGTKPVEQAASAPAQAAPKLEVVPDPQGEESNTNVLQEIDPNAEATAAAAKTEQSGKSKEEELLSEFEKMLAS